MWKEIKKMTVENQESESSLEDTAQKETGTQEAQTKLSDSQVDGSATNVVEFKHPRLKGKSLEEIEAFVTLMENTNREQGRTLNEWAETRNKTTNTEKVQESAPPARPEPKAFYDNPVDVLDNRLEVALNKIVKPLQDQISSMQRRNEAVTDREKVIAKYADFEDYEPAVRLMFEKRGVPYQEADADTLEGLYYAARGYADATGQKPNRGRNTNMERTQEQLDTENEATMKKRNNAPPQHRPSSAPLPKGGNAAPKLRQLNENEARLAREYYPGLSKEEQVRKYILWQEADEEEVAYLNDAPPNSK